MLWVTITTVYSLFSSWISSSMRAVEIGSSAEQGSSSSSTAYPPPAQGARAFRPPPPDRHGARLGVLTAIGALALLAGLAAGPAWGWAICAAGLAGLLAYHFRHLSRLGRWLAHPVSGSVPEALGSWGEVLAALHRFEREAAKREEMLADA